MKITRMHKGSYGKVKAFFDVEVDGFTIKGFKLVEGIDGMFVGVPSQKDDEGKYNNTVFVKPVEMETLTKTAIKEYSTDTGTMPF